MHQDIYNAVECPLCEAPAGEECTREGGCGMRVDYFIAKGPLGIRLKVHFEAAEETGIDEPYYITEEELDWATGMGITEEMITGDTSLATTLWETK